MTGPGAVAHTYLSTACVHAEHDYCSNPVGQAGDKRPAECKFCAARCVCPCHERPAAAP